LNLFTINLCWQEALLFWMETTMSGQSIASSKRRTQSNIDRQVETASTLIATSGILQDVSTVIQVAAKEILADDTSRRSKTLARALRLSAEALNKAKPVVSTSGEQLAPVTGLGYAYQVKRTGKKREEQMLSDITNAKQQSKNGSQQVDSKKRNGAELCQSRSMLLIGRMRQRNGKLL
jgi:hypothetical protein